MFSDLNDSVCVSSDLSDRVGMTSDLSDRECMTSDLSDRECMSSDLSNSVCVSSDEPDLRFGLVNVGVGLDGAPDQALRNKDSYIMILIRT